MTAASPNSPKTIDRRNLVKGAAWSVPVIALATAAPFASSSQLVNVGNFRVVGDCGVLALLGPERAIAAAEPCLLRDDEQREHGADRAEQDGDALAAGHAPAPVAVPAAPVAAASVGAGGGRSLGDMTYREVVDVARDEVTRRYLEAVLARHRGNVTAAASHAGVERESFHRLLRRHDVRAEPFREEAAAELPRPRPARDPDGDEDES